MSVQGPILTARLVLRRFERGDVAELVPLIGDFAVADMTSRIPHPYTEADAVRFFDMLDANPDRPVFAITRRDNAALVGAAGLDMEPAHDRAELGYWVGRPFWGLGFATEASSGLLRLAFGESADGDGLRLNRVNAHHYLRNPASGRVLEKIGMRKEGVLIGHMKKWGKYEDCAAYGLTREQYRAFHNPRGASS